MSVTVDNRVATVRFDRFDLDAYDLFLRCKALPESQLDYDWEADAYTLTTPARFAALLGAEPPGRPGNASGPASHLFDYQRFIVERAFAARRFAVWADTGLGKTAMFLDWARMVTEETGEQVLILSPPQIIEQTGEEWERFYPKALPLLRLHSRENLIAWCWGEVPHAPIAIANYEKLIAGQIPELRHLGGIVADESSILKTGGGTIKWNLIHSAKGVEFKLSCTATPAPNDTMEYASQAAFLEKIRDEGEVLWTFFSRDKRGVWSVKPHAREAFYRFMASWSIYLRDPAHYGFADILSTLPDPVIREQRVDITEDQRGRMQELLAQSGRGLFDERLGVRERAKLAQLARGFLYGPDKSVTAVESRKPAEVEQLIREHVDAGRQVLVWCVFDAEAEIVAERLRGLRVAELHGSTPAPERLEAIRAFKAGDVDILVSKAALLGYGLNFQNARALVFSGFDDSYERLYQSIRRAYRFGQTETVHVDLPYVPELEGLMFDNLARKQAQFEADVAIAEANYVKALEAL